MKNTEAEPADAGPLFFTLTPGTEVVTLGTGNVVFRSPAQSLQLEGESARLFADRIVPMLDGQTSVKAISGKLSIAHDGLSSQLQMLADAGVLVKRTQPTPADTTRNIATPFHDLLQSLEVSHERVVKRLSEMRIVIIGVGSSGAQIADQLARVGIGRLVLADPFRCRNDDLSVMPILPQNAVGSFRADVLVEALKERGLITDQSIEADTEAFSETHLLDICRNADLLVCLPDNHLGRVRHWVNRIALQTDIPALFGEMNGHKAIAGPLVIPNETACYMCWRMRYLACAEDFTESMALEESRNESDAGTLLEEPTLPPLATILAGIMSTEALKAMLAIGTPSLAGKTVEINAWNLDLGRHHVLRRPACPVCAEKKKHLPEQPNLTALGADRRAPGEPLRVAERLVSPICGVVRNFRRICKDPSEPERPFIYRAELSNARFLEKGDKEDRFIVCSGKGYSQEQAQRSALGEAVERYSALIWGEERIVRASYEKIREQALDPRRLVLYRPEQYQNLPYDPFDDERQIGWVRTRSLCHDRDVMAPALGVLMAYEVQPDEAYLFPITSNGLAAGPTLTDAILSGALEVIERDAFLNLWLHRLPATAADPSTHPDGAIREIWESYRRRGVDIALYRMPTDNGVHAFIAIGFGSDTPDEPAAVVGLGADYSPTKAAASAVLEVAQVRPALRIRMRDPNIRKRIAELLADPHQVKTLSDHDLLYCDRSQLKQFAFLNSATTGRFEWPEQEIGDAGKQLTALVETLRNQGTDLLYGNLTTPDMEALNLYCARAIIPDYQPMHFGRNERRLAADRLFRMPQSLNRATAPAAPDDLNDAPHPLA
ncbi:MAG: TOMM precursor leader peptide-binding protein [Candidatus Thiodiazotropha sp. (ex Dulcina madagascariensis)]|nr:TOMM precursor leader peptide-binding protein [Candidatus Thiodiazotropha sp. (ex Dulcina madagascariensis)]MCU7928154.1 TOMM precursor leader peptide-binding protein [Candidatus Thiodiazotropha sp. (ex Dulcina madagascariensis)]